MESTKEELPRIKGYCKNCKFATGGCLVGDCTIEFVPCSKHELYLCTLVGAKYFDNYKGPNEYCSRFQEKENKENDK